MTAKDFLRQYEYAMRRETRLHEEYRKECELIDSVRSSANVDGMPHAFSINKSVEDRAIKLADKAMKWKEATLDALHIRQEVFEVIDQIDGVKADLLKYRYLDLMQWEEICVTIKYAWAQTHRLHAEALEDVERIING